LQDLPFGLHLIGFAVSPVLVIGVVGIVRDQVAQLHLVVVVGGGADDRFFMIIDFWVFGCY
jgi:hypothetical protein